MSEHIDRRKVLRGLSAVAATGGIPHGGAEAKRKHRGTDDTETAVEGEGVVESRGALHARLLDEYATGLKTRGHFLEKGPVSSMLRILRVPTVEEPEKYPPEERTFVYGPLSADLEHVENLPIIPAKDDSTGAHYNGAHIEPKSMLTLSRFVSTARLPADALAARKEGREALVVDFENPEHEKRLVTSLTPRATAELHATRAVLHALIYRTPEGGENKKRSSVFVTGVLVDYSRFAPLSAVVERAYCAGAPSEEEREWRRKSLRGTLLFLPAFGHISVRDLIHSASGMGAPLLDAAQNVVGIVKNVVILSDERKGPPEEDEEPLPLSVFLVEGPYVLRNAQSMSLVSQHELSHPEPKEGK